MRIDPYNVFDVLKSFQDPIAAFVALTDHAPYAWQRRLYCDWLVEGETPEAIDVPTGLGKTMVMALWLIARAAGADLPRRLVYVVDRRTVVDQATEEAEKIAAALNDKDAPAVAALRAGLGLDAGESLALSTLRGQHVDNREWLKAPHKPAIIVGTIDMIGSRLMFEGYGVSRGMRPMHAGLLGADAWVLFDEAHLVPPFQALLRAVAALTQKAPVPGFRATSLSATGRNARGRIFALSEADIETDARAKKRLEASKRLALQETTKGELAKAMAERACQLANDGGRRVIVFSNSRKTAQAIAGLIEKIAPEAPKPELLVGARRWRERETLKESEVFERFSPAAGPGGGPAFLVATSAGEVGVDLDADALVCDLAPWERMIQRLGRVNRRAEPGVAPVVVFDAIADDDEDKDESSADELRNAIAAAFRELLSGGAWPLGEDGAREASPLALRRLEAKGLIDAALRDLLERARTPEPLRPALTPALVDAWSMTSLEEHTGRPFIEPWLRGWLDKEPQARVLWRKILPPAFPDDARATLERLRTFFEAAPPHLSEILETYAYEVADLAKRRAGAAKLGGHDIAAVILDPAGGVRRYYSPEGFAKTPPGFRDLAGQTLVLDARLGGLDANGLLDAKANESPPTLDGEHARWPLDSRKIGFRVRAVEHDADPERGWPVAFRCPATVDDEDGEGKEIRVDVYRGRSNAAGDLALSRKPQTLADHCETIVAEACNIAIALALPAEFAKTLEIAAHLHDLGKQRGSWQRAMNAPRDGGPYAKTEGGGNLRLLQVGEETYRHEFGSLRDAEQNLELLGLAPDLRELALHLIAAHHGFARPVIAPVDPDEPPSLSRKRAQAVALRYARLQKQWGWWGLAWWETLLRAADWAASASNDAAEAGDG